MKTSLGIWESSINCRTQQSDSCCVRGFTSQVLPQVGTIKSGQGVLLIEDDDATAEALVDLCLHYSLRVRRAASMFGASRELDRWRPAVALIDLGLPDGNGVHLVRRIRSSGATTKIGVITNAADEQTIDRVRAARPDAIFSKPLVALEIVKWVRQSTELQGNASRRSA